MIAKNINIEQFRDAIRIAFEGDSAIYPLYNPKITVNSVEDIVDDISYRIEKETENSVIKGVFDKNKLIGYYVYNPSRKALVSFGLNIAYRQRKILKSFWSIIRTDLKGKFQAFLWSRNERGIKWLLKNGMKIVAADNLLTHLIY